MSSCATDGRERVDQQKCRRGEGKTKHLGFQQKISPNYGQNLTGKNRNKKDTGRKATKKTEKAAS